jgi:hypothetical protein
MNFDAAELNDFDAAELDILESIMSLEMDDPHEVSRAE